MIIIPPSRLYHQQIMPIIVNNQPKYQFVDTAGIYFRVACIHSSKAAPCHGLIICLAYNPVYFLISIIMNRYTDSQNTVDPR